MQVITCSETIRAFVRALGPKGFVLYDSLSVVLVNTVDEMATRVKSYIDLEITMEGRKTVRKETKNEAHEGKKSGQRHQMVGNDD